MKKITTFLYHDVSDDFTSSGFQNPRAYEYTHSCQHFMNDLDLILESTPSSREVTHPTMDGGLPEVDDSLLFTFDDGGSSSMYIADVLEAKGIYGYFFVTTSKLGEDKFLTKQNLRDLVERGHVVGTHTHHHYHPFRLLDYATKVYEWSHSRMILEDVLSQAVVTSSIPGGAMDRDTFYSAEEAGIKLVFSTEPTRYARAIGNVYCLGRICPKRTTHSSVILKRNRANSLFLNSLMWKCKAMILYGKNKATRKRATIVS